MKKLTISVSPHIYSPVDTKFLMKGVLKALIPAVIASLYFFRGKAAILIVTAVFGAVITEYLIQKFRKQKIQTGNYSAAITGLLLALVLPPSIPLWMCFLGSVFAVALGKEIFGGLGHNVFNPALLARAFLMAAFPVHLTTWSNPLSLDTVTTATPLGLEKFEHFITPYISLFVGNVSGSIGETSAIALLIGIGYLLYKKIIDFRIPVAFMGTVFFISGILHLLSPGNFAPPLFHIFAGGLIIGAGFMATDPVTSPVTSKGRWVFGIGCGIIVVLIRNWGGLPEGVMYSILLMNAITPLINRATKPGRYGVINGR